MTDPTLFQNYIPIISSILAIAISSLTLGWTIYRDAIRKPKFRVDVAVKKIIQAGHGEDGPYLFVEALNMGPIPNRIGLPFVRKSWIKRRLLDRKNGGAMVYPDYHHWATTKASTRIEVGDKANFVFPYYKASFLTDDFLEIGVADGFGRMHWAPKKDFRKVREKDQKDFPAAILAS